jgi:hypothetical protein
MESTKKRRMVYYNQSGDMLGVELIRWHANSIQRRINTAGRIERIAQRRQ